MIDKRILLIGLFAILVMCAVVMHSFPTEGLLKALPLTFIILCLAMRRFFASLNKNDNDDNPSLDKNNNLKNE